MAYESSVPYRARTEGDTSFRLPAVVPARSGPLLAGPAHPSARALMTLRTSHDGGLTRRTAHTVGGLPAACSDLVRLGCDSVGLLYETGDFSAYSTITFRRIPVEEPT